MSLALPPDLQTFVAREVACGTYTSQEELLTDAVRVLRELLGTREQFQAAVNVGLKQLDRGEFVEYDSLGLRQRFEQLRARIQTHPNTGADR